MGKARTVTALQPDELARHRDLAYSLWLPTRHADPPRGVVILHGADSCKESHYDFARTLVAAGCAVLAYDQRGHGESAGFLDARAIDDAVAMAGVLRAALGAGAGPDTAIGLRGSSMGGCLSILAAARVRAAAIVAICPPSPEQLARGLRSGRFRFKADAGALAAALDELDLTETVESLRAPLLLMHAEGDETVPVAHSRELAACLAVAGSRLLTAPGGHHRSVQHDAELQAASVRFLDRHLRSGRAQWPESSPPTS